MAVQPYNPASTDRSGEIYARGTQQIADLNRETMSGLGKNIGGALSAIGGMYGKYKDKKEMLSGMDTAMGALSDLGVITPDFRDKYMSADEAVRPFLYQAIASPMFQVYQKKQGYAAYADAMSGLYGGRSGSAPGPNNEMWEF